MQLQIHPNKRSIRLKEGLHLIEEDVVVELPGLADLPGLLVGRVVELLAALGVFDLLAEDLLLEGEDEVLERTGDHIVGAE